MSSYRSRDDRDELLHGPHASPDRQRHRDRSRERSDRRTVSDDHRDRDRDAERDRYHDRQRDRERSRSPLRDREREREKRRERRRTVSTEGSHRRDRRDRERGRSHSRSRSRSVDRERRDKKDKKDRSGQKRRRSRSSASDSDSSEEDRRRRRRRKEKKEKKKEKKEKKKKKGGFSGGEWGKYGIINDGDLYNKDQEFRAWLVEERMLNPETMSKDQTKKEFARFVEDFNTATLPHEKFYHMEAYEKRMNALRSGEYIAPANDGYDPNADLRDVQSKHKRAAVEHDSYLNRDQLQALRKVQQERIEAGKMKLLGMDVKQNMGVRMDGTKFDNGP